MGATFLQGVAAIVLYFIQIFFYLAYLNQSGDFIGISEFADS